jgi:hypothetical protein
LNQVGPKIRIHLHDGTSWMRECPPTMVPSNDTAMQKAIVSNAAPQSQGLAPQLHRVKAED